MGETCAVCGKTLSWLNRPYGNSRWLEKHPEWKDKKICFGCLTEINKKDRGFDPQRKLYKCQYCGEEYRHVHNCYEMQSARYGGLRDHYEKEFRIAREQGRQIVVIKDAVLSADGIGKHIENYSKAAENFGYAYKSETHFPDSVGISLSIIFEKIHETKNVQVFLDFSSLKDELAKGGVVMTTYKCPNCNGMVDIPETGKVLMCQYCGTPIKPVDIFDKIKSLMQ